MTAASLKWLADENFRGAITRSLLRRHPELDLVRAQDVSEIIGGPESVPLAWATANNRIVIEDVLLLNDCSIAADWISGLLYLPMR